MPTVLSPRDLVTRPDMDETVLSSYYCIIDDSLGIILLIFQLEPYLFFCIIEQTKHFS